MDVRMHDRILQAAPRTSFASSAGLVSRIFPLQLEEEWMHERRMQSTEEAPHQVARQIFLATKKGRKEKRNKNAADGEK